MGKTKKEMKILEEREKESIVNNRAGVGRERKTDKHKERKGLRKRNR